ncbi:glutamine-hydrolyzing carbamoyl-phosphate synthase small subunit [Parabacteroides acidifaciens]|uniref:Carbamoyl phosphate synthase small chain n=1 Tax=Parabacteroides acidifaciens TaxID=2290935 RepID=A0A3D8HDF2_9BACT|nr:glutamine-hydrolyzing carbamoyl-phosphate synthase small subunit [Parabacteroides acidifaciens]MBC8602284.1 glutamine-hydrolyzing carbamoyl-phosphate synthase small subunit [Parabacteroides acidifaciens]RDU49005.1 carbamoyl-phosphate synthase (glutamine-hydrolyzing) small subunit [Parabacteroides acidifaciens]
MQVRKTATLVLDDGSEFHGFSFGYDKAVAGEVVFNTAMTGYPESLTDPSYAGQLMVLTYPLVGNYGVPPFSIEENDLPTFMESEKIHAEAIIVSDYSEEYSHWNAVESLSDWLKREMIPGITGIDTRALTKKIREHGVMMGRIVISDADNEVESGKVKDESEMPDYGSINYVDRVSCKDIIVYRPDGTSSTYPIGSDNFQLSSFNSQLKHVVLLDCGVKANIIRCLLKRNVTVVRVPWDYDFNTLEYDGLFISNGPGDPDTCDVAVQHIRKALAGDKPICGICMGNQLLAKAGGASIYKLKYGHRSHNQPVRMVGTERCFITSQNHGYAVDNDTLGADWEPLFINMNDGTNEGIKHKTKPFFSSQFHPEACSGPTDTEFIFDKFVALL